MYTGNFCLCMPAFRYRMMLLMVAGLFSGLLTAEAPGSMAASFWRVVSSSNILIEGSSNVNSFKCAMVRYNGADQLLKQQVRQGEHWDITGAVTMKVARFDCENNMMTRDFRETLKATQYPDIVFELITLSVPDRLNGRYNTTGRAKITIAGKTRIFNLHWDLIPENEKTIRLTGTHDFRFTQFDLTPPNKMMGLIQVRDEIRVHFDLVIERI